MNIFSCKTFLHHFMWLLVCWRNPSLLETEVDRNCFHRENHRAFSLFSDFAQRWSGMRTPRSPCGEPQGTHKRRGTHRGSKTGAGALWQTRAEITHLHPLRVHLTQLPFETQRLHLLPRSGPCLPLQPPPPPVSALPCRAVCVLWVSAGLCSARHACSPPCHLMN